MLKKTLLATVALPFLLGTAYAQTDATPTDETVQEDVMPDEGLDTEMETDADVIMDDDLPEDPMADDPMADDAADMDAPATDAPTDDAAVADEPAAAPGDGEVLLSQQAADELRSNWIVGSTVMSTQEEVIGSIDELILNAEDGSVNAAIVSVGGFLGIGSKSIAINWSELMIDYDGQDIRLALTREEADAAEEYVFRDRQDAPAPAMDTGMDTAPAAPVAQ